MVNKAQKRITRITRFVSWNKYFLIWEWFKLYSIDIQSWNNICIVYSYNQDLIRSNVAYGLRGMDSDNKGRLYDPYNCMLIPWTFQIIHKSNINLFMDYILNELLQLKTNYEAEDISWVLEDICVSLKVHSATTRKYIRLLNKKICEQ